MGTYLELNYLKDLQGEFSSIEFDGEQPESPYLCGCRGAAAPDAALA